MNLNKLRGLRAEKRLSQKALADLIGMPSATYISKEQGKSDFKVNEIIKIADALNVDKSIFFDD
jgi:transcriptional regulator with XRE-family HTH domain